MRDNVTSGPGRRPAAMTPQRTRVDRRCARSARLGRMTAAALVAALIVLAPAGPAAHAEEDPLAKARAYIAEANYTAASDLLRTVTRQDDTPIEAWLLLGTAYEAQGLNRRAIEAYEQVMRLDKNHLEGGLGLGRNLALERGKRPRAVSLYKSLLKVYPGEPRLHFALGMTYNEMAEVGYAFEQYKAIKDTSPDLAQKLYDAIFLR